MKRVIELVEELAVEMHQTPVVLFLEDNPLDRELTKRTFDRIGVEVVLAKDVGQAIAELEVRIPDNPQYPFDLALIDLHMASGPPGTEFMRILKVRAPEVPIALVTGTLGGPLMKDASEIGYFGLVEKPLTELRAEEMLHHHRIPFSKPPPK